MKYVHKLWSSYLDYQEKRAAYMTLQALTDYQLRDIGIGSRSDIRRMVWHKIKNQCQIST